MKTLDIGLLLLDLAGIIVLARLFGALAKRLGQPPVIGEILAGILLGPTLIVLTFGGGDAGRAAYARFSSAFFPPDVKLGLTALAAVGLVLFMFIVGYELDQSLVRGRERVAASVSVGSILVPFTLGAGLAVWLAGRHPTIGGTLPFALFLGAAMSVTAFPVLARILTDRGMHRTRVGGLALAAAAVDDVLAWSLLAVVVTVAGGAAGGGHDQWHLFFSLPYVLVMFVVVRPLLRRLVDLHAKAGRLTPGILAVVLVGLLLSCYATEWLGVHYIFGAFLFGVAMPREGAEALRVEILERLEQVSVLLLLPVFFVVSGLRVDLSGLGASGLVELALILAVAIVGKFVGAWVGARLQRVRSREAAVLATLMNTRGLTEIVILTVGLEIGVLDSELFSLMVVMALVTTAMAGPLLHLVYPRRHIERDIAEAERAALGITEAYRVVVVVGDPSAQASRVDLGLDLVGERRPAELVVSHLVPYRTPGLEVGTGLSGELLEMTRTMGELETLAARARSRDVDAPVLSRFSHDVARDLPVQVAAAEPAVLVVAADQAGYDTLREQTAGRMVTLYGEPPEAPAAVALCWSGGADGAATLHVAAQIAAGRGIDLVVDDGARPGRRANAAVEEIRRHGVQARTGTAPPDALVIAADGATDAHLTVRAERDAPTTPVSDWAPTLSARIG